MERRLAAQIRLTRTEIRAPRSGQAAAIRLQAFNPAITPELIGQVSLISADVIIEPQTNAAYYLVRVHVGQDELAKLKDRPLVPGMAAEALIGTQPSTVLRYLLKPLSDRIARVFRER